MTQKTTVSLKEMALGYGISVKTLSNRIKVLIPAKQNTIIRVLYPSEIKIIVAELGPFDGN